MFTGILLITFIMLLTMCNKNGRLGRWVLKPVLPIHFPVAHVVFGIINSPEMIISSYIIWQLCAQMTTKCLKCKLTAAVMLSVIVSVQQWSATTSNSFLPEYSYNQNISLPWRHIYPRTSMFMYIYKRENMHGFINIQRFLAFQDTSNCIYCCYSLHCSLPLQLLLLLWLSIAL